MNQLITSAGRFATLFNSKVPGAYRPISADDIRLMTECGLVGRYGYYGREDMQTVIGILRYEQLREKRAHSPPKDTTIELPHCKSCGEPVPPPSEGKRGRPKEYCSRCEASRAKERSRRWRRRRLKQKVKTEIGVM